MWVVLPFLDVVSGIARVLRVPLAQYLGVWQPTEVTDMPAFAPNCPAAGAVEQLANFLECGWSSHCHLEVKWPGWAWSPTSDWKHLSGGLVPYGRRTGWAIVVGVIEA